MCQWSKKLREKLPEQIEMKKGTWDQVKDALEHVEETERAAERFSSGYIKAIGEPVAADSTVADTIKS